MHAITTIDDRSSPNPTSWQYPIINYPVFNANNSTNTSEYFSLSLNTVNRKGNLRLPEFGQDDILVKPTSINNWILLPSEGCFDFFMRNAQNSIRSFCRRKKPWLCSWQKGLRCTVRISIYFKFWYNINILNCNFLNLFFVIFFIYLLYILLTYLKCMLRIY